MADLFTQGISGGIVVVTQDTQVSLDPFSFLMEMMGLDIPWG